MRGGNVRIQGREVVVEASQRPPLSPFKTTLLGRLFDASPSRERSRCATQLASLERERTGHLKTLDDALLVLGTQAVEHDQRDGDAAGLVRQILAERAALSRAAHATADLARLEEEHRTVLDEQARVASATAADAAARRLYLTRRLGELVTEIANARGAVGNAPTEPRLLRQLGRTALETGAVIGVSPEVLASAEQAQLAVARLGATIEGYRDDLRALGELPSRLSDLVAVLALAASATLVATGWTGRFEIGVAAAGGLTAAGAPFLIGTRARQAGLLRALMWVAAFAAGGGALFLFGGSPAATVISMCVIAAALAGSVVSMRRLLVPSSGGILAFVASVGLAAAAVVWTRHETERVAGLERERAHADFVASYRRLADLACGGRPDDDLLASPEMLDRAPWSELDADTTAKLKILDSERGALHDLAVQRDEQRTAREHDSALRAQLELLDNKKTVDECNEIVAWWSKSFELTFNVVSDEGGGTYTIRTTAGEGHLTVAPGTLYTQTGINSLFVTSPGGNMYIEVPASTRGEAADCQQALAKHAKKMLAADSTTRQLDALDTASADRKRELASRLATKCHPAPPAAAVITPVTPPTHSAPEPPPPVSTAAPLDAHTVEAFVNAQAASLASGGKAFRDSLDEHAVAFVPALVEPVEGRDIIATQALPDSPTRVETHPILVGLGVEYAWVNTTWSSTSNEGKVSNVRVTEVVQAVGGHLHVIAASFSVPSVSWGPAFPLLASGVRPTPSSPAAYLASPADLAGDLLDALAEQTWKDATVLIGSDANERYVGVDAVRKALTGWKTLSLEVVGNARVIETPDFQIVLEYIRWRGPTLTTLRGFGVFVRGAPMEGPPPWQLATAHYSFADPNAAMPASLVMDPSMSRVRGDQACPSHDRHDCDGDGVRAEIDRDDNDPRVH